MPAVQVDMSDNEMACQELVEMVTSYLERALTESDRLRFEEHLATCPDCITYVKQIRQMTKMLGFFPDWPAAAWATAPAAVGDLPCANWSCLSESFLLFSEDALASFSGLALVHAAM